MKLDKIGERVQNFATVFLVHVGFLIMLSITVPAIMMTTDELQEKYNVPEPTKIEIGEQLDVPPAPTSGGSPAEQESLLPPVETETEQTSDEKPQAEIPEAMIQDPDQPPPEPLENNKEAEGLDMPQPNIPQPDGAFGPNEGDPGPDEEGTAKLYGEPIEGRTVFLLDASGSMGQQFHDSTRFEALLADLKIAISLLKDSDEFDIVYYSSDAPATRSYCQPLWFGLQTATEANKKKAFEWLEGINPDAGTPTYEALSYVCRSYPRDIDNIVLVTDGEPQNGTGASIVRAAPVWFKRIPNCRLTCISIGGDGLNFIKALAGAVDGAYTLVE